MLEVLRFGDAAWCPLWIRWSNDPTNPKSSNGSFRPILYLGPTRRPIWFHSHGNLQPSGEQEHAPYGGCQKCISISWQGQLQLGRNLETGCLPHSAAQRSNHFTVTVRPRQSHLDWSNWSSQIGMELRKCGEVAETLNLKCLTEKMIPLHLNGIWWKNKIPPFHGQKSRINQHDSAWYYQHISTISKLRPALPACPPKSHQKSTSSMWLDWFKGKFTGNHRFSH